MVASAGAVGSGAAVLFAVRASLEVGSYGSFVGLPFVLIILGAVAVIVARTEL
jgi:hypothetical protein